MKKIKILLMIMLSVLVLVSCGSSSPKDYASESTRTPAPETPAEIQEMHEEEIARDSENMNTPMGRKIISSYTVDMETKEYDESIKSLNNLISSYGGFMTQTNEGNYNNRYITMTVSIPSNKAAEFIDKVGEIENLIINEKSLNSEDVTDRYTDTELRLKTLREKLERLNALQAEQPELEELLKLENEITNTILEIERIEGSLRSMDSKIDYTTIDLSIREISSVVSTYTRPPFGDRLSTAFVESIDNFVYGLQELIIGIVYAAPSLVLLAIFIAIVYFVGRIIYRKFIKNRIPKTPRPPKGRREYGIKPEDKNENKIE